MGKKMTIDLNERQCLIDIVYNPDVYGTQMPTKINGQWSCPHCGFEHDIDMVTAHLATNCEEPEGRHPRC